ncbi:MAG: TPM domain-containing protein [Acidobacteria bacterium]|nr:TPM domain-containing protein [Acidobacteriota bacterium]
MKGFLRFCSLVVLFSRVGLCQEVPRLAARVNDYAGLLTDAEKQALEGKLADLERTDSTQVVVLTVPSLGGEAIESYSMRVAEAWKIGQKQYDNGVILLVSREDRQLRIEVGYGLEGKLTDALSKRIIDTEIVPRFRANDFYGGIGAGVDSIVEVVKGTYQADKQVGDESFIQVLVFLFLLVIGAALVHWLVSASLGALALPFAVSLYYAPRAIWYVVLAMVGFMLGAAVGFVKRSGVIGPVARGFGGPGALSGGGWSGGGGFSGGGGGFGGGGASGRW